MIDSFTPTNPALIDTPSPEIKLSPDHHPGYTPELKAGDTVDVLKGACGSASREFPKSLWIDPKDWADKARENDKNYTWALNYVDRFTNQNPTHECTCHALSRAAEGCRNRMRGVSYYEGPKAGVRQSESSLYGSVWLSPLSIYSEANPRQWGGAGCQQVLEIACRRGFLPENIQPREYSFKHSLQGTTGDGNNNQSTGPWVAVSRFPEGWQETAKHFKAQEVIFPDTWEQVVCLVLHGRLVEVGRDGHAIPYAIWKPQEQIMGYVDSYNVVRYDSLRVLKYASEGAFAIESMTAPDDWMKPAG